jgi:thiol-disulfide isomerase/thioredoxin
MQHMPLVIKMATFFAERAGDGAVAPAGVVFEPRGRYHASNRSRRWIVRKILPVVVVAAVVSAGFVASNAVAGVNPVASRAALSDAAAPPAADSVNGLWDAIVVSGKAEIPFRFEIDQNGSQVQGFFFEGEKKIGSSSGSFENGELKLNYDFLNTDLDATFDGRALHGSYRNLRPNAKPLEFRAVKFVAQTAGTTGAPKVDGYWEMFRTAPDNSKLPVSWRLYLRQSGAEVSGAILKTSGDSGFLTGHWDHGKLTMSHFAGERPLLFEATLGKDAILSITLDKQFTYKAARSNDALAAGIPVPPDPSRFTSVKDPTERFHFGGPDLNGKVVNESDPRFAGKVVMLTIGGSWCPNCHDEAPSLVDLYKDFHAQGLEIVGLNFEVEPEFADAKPRVQTFIKRYGIQYPMLIPGTPDQVADKMPQLVNFGVYPTTIILGRDGRVRSVHAGFASLATGEEHTRLLREERDLVKQLLAEKADAAHKSAGQ